RSEQDLAEVNGPDAIVDFLEADGMLLQRIGEEEQPFRQTDGARVRHALDQEVAGILDGRQRARVGPSGGTGKRSRRAIAQGRVGPFVIVEMAERVEGTLLARQARLRRSTRLALEGLMHPL